MKLHIGGTERKEGWSVLNIQPGPVVDYAGDLRDLSQFADGLFEQVYASHVLEHVGQAEILNVLRGLRRILTTGGKLMISVPDLDVLCHLFLNPQATYEIKWHTMRMMFGGQTDPHDFHYIGLNQQFLQRLFQQSGFISSQRVASFGVFNDTSEFKPHGFPISLNMAAIK